jgi:hypothetical protein
MYSHVFQAKESLTEAVGRTGVGGWLLNSQNKMNLTIITSAPHIKINQYFTYAYVHEK